MNKNDFLKYVSIIIITLLLFLGMVTLNSFKCEAIENNYVFSPIIPDKMQKFGYFRYKVRPKEVVKIPFNVYNNSNRNIKVKVSLNDAYSDYNGYINYNLKHAIGLKNKKNMISKMVVGSRVKQLSLNPHTYATSFFEIKIPNNIFKGNILGGVSASSDTSVNNSDGINNKIQYSTSVLLFCDKFLSPTLSKIHLDNVIANDDYCDISIYNQQSAIIHNNKIQIYLSKKGKRFSHIKNSNYSMAPDSLGKYRFSIKNIPRGWYLITVKMTDLSGNTKTMKKDIFINNYYSKLKTIHNVSDINKLIYVFILSIICIFIFLIIYLMLKLLIIMK